MATKETTVGAPVTKPSRWQKIKDSLSILWSSKIAVVGLIIALGVVWAAQTASVELGRHTFQIVVLASLVPAVLVSKTATEVILLGCTLAEFVALEPFNQTEFVYGDLPHHATDPSLTMLWPFVVPAKRVVGDKIRPIPPGELAVRRGARVEATDGRVGRVDEFVIDPDTGDITHLCLREGRLLGDKGVCVPVTDIDRIQEKVVHLKVDKETVASRLSFPVKRWWQ